MGASVLPSARSEIAGESKGSRWDQVRVSLVLPIGAIVAVAIICVVVAVLTSAQRADEVAFNTQQQLIRQAIVDRAERALKILDSVAATPRATQKIRESYDADWADRSVGNRLAGFNDDVVMIVGADDQIKYTHLIGSADNGASDLRAAFAPTLDLLRGRLSAMPNQAIAVIAAQDPAKPGRNTVLVQRFLDKPAIVTAVAVGSDAELASGNNGAPIVLMAKYIGDRMLNKIGDNLQVNELRQIDEPAQGDAS